MSLKTQESLGYIVNHCAKIFANQLYRQLAKYQLHPGQWPFLINLWEQDGQSLTQLSRRIGIENATTARTVDRLVRDGWVERITDSQDRRIKRVFLTDKAKKKEPILTPIAQKINKQAIQGLSKNDMKALKRILKKISTNLTK